MDRIYRGKNILSAGLLLAMASVLVTGCPGLLANLLYRGHMAPAAYDGLKEKRVAVVCVEGSSIYSPSSNAAMLSRMVEQLLRQNVQEIDIVDQHRIADWIDNNDWDDTDYNYHAIGKGVDADMVVAVEITSLSLYDGPTMYKGRADLAVTVHDMTAGGKQAFHVDSVPVVYPKLAARSRTSMSEGQFRRQFIGVLAREVAKNFYEYDIKDDFAMDADMSGG